METNPFKKTPLTLQNRKKTHADPLDTHHPIHVQKAAAADTPASHPIQDTHTRHMHIHRRKAYHSSTLRQQAPDAGAPRHHHMTGSTNDAIRRHELEAESKRLTGDCTDSILDGSLCDKPPLRVALLKRAHVAVQRVKSLLLLQFLLSERRSKTLRREWRLVILRCAPVVSGCAELDLALLTGWLARSFFYLMHGLVHVRDPEISSCSQRTATTCWPWSSSLATSEARRPSR